LDLCVRATNPLFNVILRRLLPILEPTRYDPILKKFSNANELWWGRSQALAGGEPLWIAPKGSRAIFLNACMATNFFKQAAPANDPTLGLSVGAWNKLFEPTAGENITLGHFREPLV
jgi:hypothetical protein